MESGDKLPIHHDFDVIGFLEPDAPLFVSTQEEMTMIQKGVVPQQMEDKWFIYYADSHLYFNRSWTGFCIYILRFDEQEKGAVSVDFRANRDPSQITENHDESSKETLSYLIEMLLLHRPAQFPGDGGPLAAWSVAGRGSLGQHPQ